MSKDLFDIDKLYGNAFGYVAPPYPALVNSSSRFTVAGPLKFDLAQLGIKESGKSSELEFNKTVSEEGTVLRMPVMIRPAFQKYASDDEGWYQFPNEPVFSARMQKSMVDTVMNRGRRRGVVTEEINLGPWQCALEGIIYNPEGDYPEKEMTELRQFCEQPGPMEIRCLMAKVLGFRYVNIKQLSLDRREAMHVSFATYSIGMSSDEDFDLEQIQE